MADSKNINRKFRPEIEGLRAVAALLVAIYHIWFGNVSGGVDVFFVVSGFLITTSLLSRFEKQGTIDFFSFILRLAKRLFPVGFTVLFVTTIGSILWLPQIRWDQTVSEVFASALYFQNWELATNAVDYLGQNNEASPFQHFWAMSIQGQFYIIWPILLFISVLLAIYIFKTSLKSTFLATLIIICGVSFTYSVYLTSVNQPWAYFDTFTRVWEFAIGGILSLIITHIRLPRSLSFFMGWIGLIALVTCGIILQVATVFPGYAALWPVLSAIFILVAGNQGGRFGVHRLLSTKSLMKFGGISYAFYLWHWPILLFYLLLSGQEQVTSLEGFGIILFSALLSYLSTKVIETPIRKGRMFQTNGKTALITVSLMVPVLVLTSGWAYSINQKQETVDVSSEQPDYPGAMALEQSSNDFGNDPDVDITPTPLQSRDDLPEVYDNGCHQELGESEVLECEFGETDDPIYTIALAGGSHSAHWLPALKEVAENENIQIVNYTKSGCRFSADDTEEDDCVEWNDELLDTIIQREPDLVFTTADVASQEEVPSGFIEQWEALNEANIDVFAIRDNPRLGFDAAACVAESGGNSDACSQNRGDVLPTESAWDKIDDPPENVHYADLSDAFCTDDTCPSVIGNVLVYRDNGHLTTVYSKTLAPMLKEKLMPKLMNE